MFRDIKRDFHPETNGSFYACIGIIASFTWMDTRVCELLVFSINFPDCVLIVKRFLLRLRFSKIFLLLVSYDTYSWIFFADRQLILANIFHNSSIKKCLINREINCELFKVSVSLYDRSFSQIFKRFMKRNKNSRAMKIFLRS